MTFRVNLLLIYGVERSLFKVGGGGGGGLVNGKSQHKKLSSPPSPSLISSSKLFSSFLHHA